MRRDKWKILRTVACLILGGCVGEDRAPLPTLPSANTGDTPVARPPAALYANPTGTYAVTFTASDSCQQLPSELRERSYYGAIGGGGVMFDGRFNSPSFYDRFDTFWLSTSPSGTKLWLESDLGSHGWEEGQPIIERLESGGYVALQGTADIALDTRISNARTTWDGSFAYCARAEQRRDPLFPPTCPNIVSCQSDDHWVSFVRQ